MWLYVCWATVSRGSSTIGRIASPQASTVCPVR
jgi:hypothetical protein